MNGPIRVLSAGILVLLAGVWPASPQGGNALAQTGKPNSALDILYTGMLFGYFRSPSFQSGQDPKTFGCPQDDTQLSEQGRTLWEATQKYAYLNRILVGTGDNFSLYLPSRIFVPPPDQKSQPLDQKQEKYHYSKDQFTWDWTHQKWVPNSEVAFKSLLRQGLEVIPVDNVGCALSLIGYDAIVPGRHDFYYGPERLRALARLLASPRKGKDSDGKGSLLRPVQMLAANLLIDTAWVSGHTPIPDSLKPRLPFRKDSSDLIIFPKEGDKVVPWLSRVVLTDMDSNQPPPTGSASKPAQYRAILFGRDEKPDQSDWSISVDGTIQVNAENCWASDILGWRDGGTVIKVMDSCKPMRRVTFPSNACDPGTRDGKHQTCLALTPITPLKSGAYKLCIWQKTEAMPAGSKISKLDPRPVCNRFTVTTPFFQFHGDEDLPGAKPSIPAQQEPDSLCREDGLPGRILVKLQGCEHDSGHLWGGRPQPGTANRCPEYRVADDEGSKAR